MSHEVLWSKVILEEFVRDAMLTKDEEMIMRTRVAGWTRVQQSQELNMSISTVDAIIKRLKAKYDVAQRFNPLLPPRKASRQEEYMDTH